ncbi:MurR/RpiR family transcriptional regulator [Anoxybacillus rupiensis]|uniref:MurR/RpiR family transcriptional regulator n=1 Tax=Anoxybacteroides rupiense TaxID=311460 RepID=A0ABT5W1Q6_9BACL|nr:MULTISPECIES: MurR/RpiR family transcriptional regulator [Anoxybacillus]MDE8563204.1 MurR/RpiR family transcriptional regulator [Anoxybacillus rupiensis]
MKGGFISIQEALDSLKPAERKAAEYILTHAEEVVHLSIQKLSEQANVSEATIIRLARTLNCKGFRELKLKIAVDLAKQNEPSGSSYQEIPIDGSMASIIASVSNNSIQSIQDTLSVLSIDAVEKAVHALSRARKIAVYGIGASAVIAQDLKQKLTRINRWCEAAFDYDTQGMMSANLTETDVAFGISYSGQTEGIIQALALAKTNGATVISLTKFGVNPVSELADISLYTSSLEKSIRSGAMSSRISQFNVIDILYVGIVSRAYEESIAALDRTREAVKRWKRSDQ